MRIPGGLYSSVVVQGLHARPLRRDLAVQAQALVDGVRGQGGRPEDTGDLPGHLQAASNPMPHVRHLLQ